MIEVKYETLRDTNFFVLASRVAVVVEMVLHRGGKIVGIMDAHKQYGEGSFREDYYEAAILWTDKP